MIAVLADLLLLSGGMFLFLGALGLYRMPDVYNRIQAGTKAVTLGTLALLAGIALHQPQWWPKLLVLALLILVTNPVGSSTLARAFFRSGIKPWKKGVSDG